MAKAKVTSVGEDNRTTVPKEIRKYMNVQGDEDSLVWIPHKDGTCLVMKFVPTKNTE